MKLIDTIYYYPWMGMGNNSNSYLLANVLRRDKPHIIIDPGHVVNEMGEQCLSNLLESIAKDGLNARDIGLILNTHSHIDHNEANQPLSVMDKKDAGTGKEEKTLIALHKDAEKYRKTMSMTWRRLLGTEMDFVPDFYLQEGTLNLGEGNPLVIESIESPGHSPGSLCFYLPREKVLIAGDVVFFGGIGRTDLPGGNGTTLKQSIERLANLDVEYLLPGHSTEFGGIVMGKENVERNFDFIRVNYYPLL